MVSMTGTFDGKQVILDQVPEGLAPNTRVRIIVQNEDKLRGLDAIVANARNSELPSDFAAQHHHYVKGLPKR